MDDSMLFAIAGNNPASDPVPGREHSLARVRAAYVKQQPAPVPDQLAIVWRMDLGRMLSDLTHKRAFFDYYTKARGIDGTAEYDSWTLGVAAPAKEQPR